MSRTIWIYSTLFHLALMLPFQYRLGLHVLISISPFPVHPSGLLCDLLWSDPDKDVQGWGENDRGVSFTFGADVVSKFLNRHDLDLICRAHQVIRNQVIVMRLFSCFIYLLSVCVSRGKIVFNQENPSCSWALVKVTAVISALSPVSYRFRCRWFCVLCIRCKVGLWILLNICWSWYWSL